MKPNLGLARQEQKLSKSGSNLAIALSDSKICHLSELEPIKQALRYAMLIVGVRAQNLPGDEEKAVLLNYIVKHYSGHTPAEIRLAFEMAVNGQLECDPVCYENFSVLYFTSIMNAYRLWASQEVRQNMMKEALLTREPDRLDISIEYCYYKQREINKLPYACGLR